MSSKKEVPSRARVVVGTWKFRDRLILEVLYELAESWANDLDDGPFYEELVLRKCANDQHGITFKFRLAHDDSYEAFFERMTDQLKRSFGNDFCGYDVSQECIPIHLPLLDYSRTARRISA